jgi:hypothetical protein
VAGTSPLVIGAVGGSGTRVVVRILRHLGVFVGAHLDPAEDSRPLAAWYDRWARPLLEAGGALGPGELVHADAAFAACLRAHLDGWPGPPVPWAIKVPRSLLFLAWWARWFPGFRFLHLVRDGLDMAVSRDSNQVRLYGDLVLGRRARPASHAVRAIAYWARANERAAAFGERRLGARYLRIRFEDLCAAPAPTVARMREFAGLPGGTAGDRLALAEIAPPGTIGRGRGGSPADLRALLRAGRTGLERLGYWDPGLWRAVRRDGPGAGRRALRAMRRLLWPPVAAAPGPAAPRGFGHRPGGG